MRVVCATRNPGKLREFRALFAGVPGLVLVGLDDVPPVPEIIEDGESFEANAVKKARATAWATGLAALADDSGLEVDALGGGPGVRSARYAGEGASDADNNAKLIMALRDVPEAACAARYRIVLALVDPAGLFAANTHTETGVCEGRIQLTPAGAGGFGYDPHFVPAGYACTMAELSAEAKNRISHRGEAARKMAAFLRDALATRR